jgi:hypothetical protein
MWPSSFRHRSRPEAPFRLHSIFWVPYLGPHIPVRFYGSLVANARRNRPVVHSNVDMARCRPAILAQMITASDKHNPR